MPPSPDQVGRVVSINVAPNGGVPKRPVPSAEVREDGVGGDKQNDLKHHGGPMRAVCLFPIELIDKLRGEGHPIEPGMVGENLTLEGIEWSGVGPGHRFSFDGGVELEVTSYANPCSTIRDAFSDKDSRRIKQELHSGESRLYARIIVPGVLSTGEGVRLIPPQA